MRRMYSENQVLKTIESQAQEHGLKVFENIVDKDGHARFIEGDITMETITGITQTYGKWSLSGSHLMIVLCFSIANTTVLNSTSLAFIRDLPKWIFDKLVPLWSNYLSSTSARALNDDWTEQTISNIIVEKGSNYLRVAVPAISFTASKDRNARIQFDYLIDNE